MADATNESTQQWTAKRRVALVLSMPKGETSWAGAACKHGLTVAEIEDWQDRLFLGAENAPRARPTDVEAIEEEHIRNLQHKIGGIGPRPRYLAGGAEPPPLWPGEVDE